MLVETHATAAAAAIPEPVSAELFARLCQQYPDLRLELTADGEVRMMPPASSDTGRRNMSIAGQLYYWSKQDGTGVAFDSSAGFTLPNGAIYAPDAAWIARERWDALGAEEQNRFAAICPDFVLELRSGSDRLPPLHAKMAEYIENGARLGWLLDPFTRQAHIYRPAATPVVLTQPATLDGGDVLPGFTLDLSEIL